MDIALAFLALLGIVGYVFPFLGQQSHVTVTETFSLHSSLSL